MLSRRGARRIVVDGHELIWWARRRGVRGCPDCDRLRVFIAGASRRGSLVAVQHGDAWGPDVPITPRLVAETARAALRAGWRPGEGTGYFTGRHAKSGPDAGGA